MKEVTSVYIVILLVGFTVVDVHADVNDEELAAVIDALTATEARSAVADTLTNENERTSVDKGSCAVKNVAIHKPAKASSTYSPHSVAGLAVDGNLEQRFFGSKWGAITYCFSTRDTPHANKWWYVDLQQIYIIEKVKFYNRIDCCPERARQFKILVGDTLDEMTEVGFVETMGSTKTVTMPPNTRGRYVKLVQAITAVFHMCEVEVYAIPEYCRNPCENGGVLSQDAADGYKCVCPAYRDYRYLGANCEEIWIKLPSNPTY